MANRRSRAWLVAVTGMTTLTFALSAVPASADTTDGAAIADVAIVDDGTTNAVAAPPGTTYRGRVEEPSATPDTPNPEPVPASELEALDSAPTTAPDYSPGTAASVASGYKLRGNNKTGSYIYSTDKKDFVLYRCSGSACTDIGRVGVTIRQNVTGGSSTRWTYTISMQRFYGPRYSGDATYQCARNISYAPDNYCQDYSDNADGYDAITVAAAPGTLSNTSASFNKTFGTAVNSKKYGMLRGYVKWLDYNVVARGDDGDYGVKCRMWDTKRFSTSDAHLETATGTGT